MITVLAAPLVSSEVARLRAWLNQPEGEIFRHVLASNIAALQVESGSAMVECVDKENQMDQTAIDKARDAAAFHHALAIFERFKTDDAELVTVTLAVDQGVVTEPEPTKG